MYSRSVINLLWLELLVIKFKNKLSMWSSLSLPLPRYWIIFISYTLVLKSDCASSSCKWCDSGGGFLGKSEAERLAEMAQLFTAWKNIVSQVSGDPMGFLHEKGSPSISEEVLSNSKSEGDYDYYDIGKEPDQTTDRSKTKELPKFLGYPGAREYHQDYLKSWFKLLIDTHAASRKAPDRRKESIKSKTILKPLLKKRLVTLPPTSKTLCLSFYSGQFNISSSTDNSVLFNNHEINRAVDSEPFNKPVEEANFVEVLSNVDAWEGLKIDQLMSNLLSTSLATTELPTSITHSEPTEIVPEFFASTGYTPLEQVKAHKESSKSVQMLSVHMKESNLSSTQRQYSCSQLHSKASSQSPTITPLCEHNNNSYNQSSSSTTRSTKNEDFTALSNATNVDVKHKIVEKRETPSSAMLIMMDNVQKKDLDDLKSYYKILKKPVQLFKVDSIQRVKNNQ